MLSLITFGVDCPVLLYSRSWIKRVIPVPWPLRLRMANALDARVDQLEQNLDRLWTRVERTEDRVDRLYSANRTGGLGAAGCGSAGSTLAIDSGSTGP